MSLFMPAYARKGGTVSTLSLVGSVIQSSTATIAIPSTAAIGDLAVLLQGAQADSLPSVVTPSGFTLIGTSGVSANSNAVRLAPSYRVLTQAGAATLTGMNGSDGNQKALLILRPDKPITSVVAVFGEDENTGAPTSQSLDFTGQKPPIFLAGMGSADAGANPTGTIFSTGTLAYSVANFKARYRIANAPVGVETLSMPDGGTANAIFLFGLIVS